MLYSYLIYDFPLEYIVDGCLNVYQTDYNFIKYPSSNIFFFDFMLIDCGWECPIDYSIFNNLEYVLYIEEKFWLNLWCGGYFEFIDDVLILETHKILDKDIVAFNYVYDLFFINSEIYNYYESLLFINNEYIYIDLHYLNFYIYISLFSELVDFINYLNFFFISIIVSLFYIINFIYSYLFGEMCNMIYLNDIIFNNSILWISNIFYDFLDHSTYKNSIVYYIYLIYICLLNILLLLIIILFLKINIFIYLKIKFFIKNFNYFIEYINITNNPFYLNKNKMNNFKINLKISNFKINLNPNTNLFFILLFIKRIGRIYFIKYIFSLLKGLKKKIINIVKYLYKLLLILISYIIKFLLKFIWFIKEYIIIINTNNIIINNLSSIYDKLLFKLKYLYKQQNIKPIHKFIEDKEKFKIKIFKNIMEKLYNDILNKIYIDIQGSDAIYYKYWKYLQSFYLNYTYIMITKFIKILLFIFLFIIKFLLFKSFKYIIKITIFIKFLHILTYYTVNIYLYLKIFIKHLYLKYIWYIYFKIRNNIIYYFNMFIHYKILKLSTRFFMHESYYLNSEMVDKFPYYSSKHTTNFFTWFGSILNKTKYNTEYIKIISLIFKIMLLILNILSNLFLLITLYSIKFIYFIITIKINIIKIIMNNKNNFIYFIYFCLILTILYITIKYTSIWLISSILNFNQIEYIVINILYLIILILVFKGYWYYYIINFFLWNIGFYIFFIYDSLLYFIKSTLNIFIVLFKYFIFYPFILFIILFILFNNPIIYAQFCYILKIIILPLINIIYDITDISNNYVTISLFINMEQILYYQHNINTIDNKLSYANSMYIEWSSSINTWFIYNKIDFIIFLNNIWIYLFSFDGLYAIITTLYETFKNIIKYFFLLIWILIIYYFWSFLFIISDINYIFIWLNYLTIDEFIFTFIYTSKLIYIILFKFLLYSYIYINIPYYIIQPTIYIYLNIYEYYFYFWSFTYNFYLIYELKIIIIYLYLFFNWIINILHIITEYMIYSIIIGIHHIFNSIEYHIFYLYKYIYVISTIYVYLYSDILFNIKLTFILNYMYIYTNIDFFIFNKSFKFIIFEDSLYSSFRFPLDYYQKMDNRKYLYKYFQKNYSYLIKERIEYLKDILTFDYSNENTIIGRWKEKTFKIKSKIIISQYEDNIPQWYQTINNNPHYSIKYLYYSYKIFKYKKILLLFPYLWSLFWTYYIFTYIISCFLLIIFYKILFNNNYNNLYNSNTYSWDILREKTINKKYKLLKNNNLNLYNYYFDQVVRSKEDYILCDEKNKFHDHILYRYKFSEKDIKFWEENNEKLNKNISDKKKIIIHKYKYVYIYKQYIVYKKAINQLLKNKSIYITYNNLLSIYNTKFKALLTLKKKFFKVHNSMIKYTNFTKKITFDFKSLMLFDKYQWLYNIFFIQEKKFNIFSTYHFNLNPYIPFIYDRYYEEPFIDGPIELNISQNNYKYLSKNIYNLYFFYKWFDYSFLSNKGSFYLFHKDPRVPFVGLDSKNNKYYFNSSSDYNNQFYILFIFIAIPLIIWSTYLSSILHFSNEIINQDKFDTHLTFWFSWFMTQFSLLHQGILKIAFSFMGDSMYMFTLDNIEDLPISNGDTEYNNWFFYYKRTKHIYPLYNYYNTEYYLSQIFRLSENINLVNLIFLHIKFNLLNLYDIIYENNNWYNFYSFELIIYSVIRFIFIIFLLINYKNYKFYNYKKISINLFKFTYNLRNN